MPIASSKTREQFPLSYKKIIKKTIARGIFIPILLIPLWKTTLFFVSVLFITIFLIYLYQYWYFAVYFYDLTPDFIQIRKGPITPREITIPYERIQDVYVDQDILDRIFGLYDVHLSTATISSGIEAHIDGVEKQAAEGLRNLLLETVKQKISENKKASISLNENPIS